MSYTPHIAQINELFRVYKSILEDGIPSVLQMFQASAKSPVTCLQNDRSVRTPSDMGSKIIRCIAHEEELKAALSSMEATLDSMEDSYADLLKSFYCDDLTRSEALKESGLAHKHSFKYAQALFAMHHPAINFGQNDFDQICAEIGWNSDQVHSVKEVQDLYADFKAEIMAAPGTVKEMINELPELRDGVLNSFFTDTTQTDRQFFRDRNTLIVALFYQSYPYIAFSTIAEILKTEQGGKRYLTALEKQINQENN